jgi:hypothetical protein
MLPAIGLNKWNHSKATVNLTEQYLLSDDSNNPHAATAVESCEPSCDL